MFDFEVELNRFTIIASKPAVQRSKYVHHVEPQIILDLNCSGLKRNPLRKRDTEGEGM